jgi:Uma2 family endonuclease
MCSLRLRTRGRGAADPGAWTGVRIGRTRVRLNASRTKSIVPVDSEIKEAAAPLLQVVDPDHVPAILEGMDSAVASASRLPSVGLVPEPPGVEDSWVLTEETMPESNAHRDIVDLLRLLLLAFIARTGRHALAVANLACRWNAAKRSVGVDPDIALIEPAPPEGDKVESLLTWKPGHVPPRFAIEVVSASNPLKDYSAAPAKYARLGTRELVIFDPARLGPKVRGGPHVLQVWRRDEPGARMVRVYAGDGPAFSEELGAWLVPTPQPRLRIADDPEGRSLWLTEAEEQAAARQLAEEARRRLEQDSARGMRAAVEDLCEIFGIPLDAARRAALESLDVPGLDALRGRIKKERAWPSSS